MHLEILSSEKNVHGGNLFRMQWVNGARAVTVLFGAIWINELNTGGKQFMSSACLADESSQQNIHTFWAVAVWH